MTAHCAALNMFGGDEWNARAYGSLSIASRVSARIQSNTQILTGRKLLVKLNSTLANFFADIRPVMEGKVPSETREEVTPEKIAKARTVLKDLDEVLSKVYVQAKRTGLTNRTLTAGPLRTLREHIDELQDLREWFEMISNIAPVKELFERAEREAHTEPVFDLSKVR
jgi:hypothetical protein